MIRRFSRSHAVPVLLLALFVAPLAPAAARAERTWSAFPPLVSIAVDGETVTATSGIDSSGRVVTVSFDGARNSWSLPVAAARPEVTTPRLDQVLVFNGSLFDQFRGEETIELGDGFVLARRDTGFALLEGGEDRGWPAVTQADIDSWGREVRLGLPREDPEGQLYTLFATGRLRNVPGPVARTTSTLWFGLAGGFTSGEGQFGGLVAYDLATRSFRVVRHKFIVDATVTRLLVTDDELWIGTGRYGPQRLEGMRGMLLFRPLRREWRQFSPENSRISGDLVYDAVRVGKHLWVTTNQGVSRYDTARHLWHSWYWHAAPEGTGPRLTQDRPVDPADELLR